MQGKIQNKDSNNTEIVKAGLDARLVGMLSKEDRQELINEIAKA